MALEGTASPGQPGLPPLGSYVRTVVALGLGSIRLALPALAFLYFYRLGMGLYLAFSDDSGSAFGSYERGTLVTSAMMHLAAYLPLLVLIYTPFLPLQDGILKGRPRSFMESVRMVLERLLPFALSGIAQFALLFGPPVFLFGGMALLVRTLPTRPEELVRVLALATLLPCLLYVAIIALFLMFAIPSLVLDARGPLASIRQSFTLVGRHFGGILGRLLVAFLLLVLAAVVASLPEAILRAVAAASGMDHPALRIAQAIVSAAVSALIFPFSVAAILVLYRASNPATEWPGGTIRSSAAGEPAHPTTPFVFE